VKSQQSHGSKTWNFSIGFFLKCHFKKCKKSHFLDFQKNIKNVFSDCAHNMTVGYNGNMSTLMVRCLSVLIQKAWLRVRNLTARCLVAADRVLAADMQSASLHHADGNSVNNGETSVSPPTDAVMQLGNELKTTLAELSSIYASQPTDQVIAFIALHSFLNTPKQQVRLA